MASSIPTGAIQRSTELCRYFLSNQCRYGDKCFYSHDRSNNQSNNACRYYLRGKCMYGDRCRYDHVRPKPQLALRSIDPISELFDGQSQSFCETNNEVLYQPSNSNEEQQSNEAPNFTISTFCPYAEKNGLCEALDAGRFCPYLHGDACDFCNLPVLDPTDDKQREEHRLECLKKHEAECEEAFAIQRSQEKKCGICLEKVWDRDGDKRFGLLENCDHIFCLECIRKWRSSSNYEHKVVKACPECRTKSDFVTPTKYWPENDQAKNNAIQAYKENLQKIHCKFFKRGDGVCPFGSKCFYLHVDKRGQYVQLGPPRRRRRMNTQGEFESLSDILMVSIFSSMDVGRFFDELDYLFNDDDDDDDDMESYGSYLTNEDDFQFAEEHDLTDNEEEFRSWH
ncbi:unnamed protein product [Adineta ricciae]|uniref:RING-type E3 ubiquitin transferase n=1 Tax=Adineta ricciae TaxID=249248 RepID=A0A815M6N6_ADIRI|nr:unnamed protein product [Adineta ricciae]